MVKRILPLLSAAVLVPLSSGATIPVRVVGTTQTQAVLLYNAPDANACTISVLDSSSNPVNDTNLTLFAGADSDLRGGNIATGTSRVTVVGKRTSELAADGKLYSRALQADSLYTFQVSCNGGSARGSASFRTRTIPLGNAGPDPFPFNDKGYGNYAYPTVDYADPSKTYVDPQTGILLKRLTTPGYGSPGVFTLFAPFVAYDLAGTWQNVQNVLAQDGQFATYSGPGGPSNSIFVPTPTYQGQRAYMPYSENYIDDMKARLNGFGDQQSSVDRTVSVCLTADGGQTCVGNTLTFVLPLATASEISGPGTFPAPFFGGWGAPSIQADWVTADFAGNSPSVTVNHSVVTNTTPLLVGTYQFAFPSNLRSGMHIRIAGSAPTCPGNDCTIVSGTDATHLTIQQDLGVSFAGAATTLTAAVSGGATSISVANASGFIPNFAMRSIYFLNVESDSVQCTGLSGNVFSGCTGVTNGHAGGAAVTSSSLRLRTLASRSGSKQVWEQFVWTLSNTTMWLLPITLWAMREKASFVEAMSPPTTPPTA
jgi:hypothetical protein